MRILLFIYSFLSFLQAFAGSPFDGCVSGLYGKGGLSIREAQEACLHNHDPAVVSCQNNLFQKAFVTPQESLSSCEQDKNADMENRQGDLYHGQFQSIPSTSGKKTVCSITVNSEEEKQSFQKLLPSSSYQFVELLPQPDADRFITRDSDWMARSCQSQAHCDVLVISGHFAESFIGDKGFEVSMQDFQDFKQKPECQNFFSSIKEVYLFGCNTLASKNADSRSIQDYINVLIVDGVAPHTAQRIAARRYTVYDQSVAEKMKGIFSSADFIAGFTTVGPSGKSVQGTLEKYLSIAYSNNSEEDLRKKAFAQTLGRLGMNMVTPDPHAKSFSSPAAAIVSHMDSSQAVLKFIHQYGQALPVPAVDVVRAAQDQGLLKGEDLAQVKVFLKTQWLSLSASQKRHELCPLLLADEQDWLPAPLNCESNLDWMFLEN